VARSGQRVLGACVQSVNDWSRPTGSNGRKVVGEGRRRRCRGIQCGAGRLAGMVRSQAASVGGTLTQQAGLCAVRRRISCSSGGRGARTARVNIASLVWTALEHAVTVRRHLLKLQPDKQLPIRASCAVQSNRLQDVSQTLVTNYNTHTRPFVWDYPGEPVPER